MIAMKSRVLDAGGPAFALAAALLAGGCESLCGDEECAFTRHEWSTVTSLSPLPDPPLDPTNKYDGNPAAIQLGQMLFFEKRYSNALKVTSQNGNVGDKGKIGCVSCHDPLGGFSDTKSNPNNMSVGVSWTTRNTPSLVNTVYYGSVHGWDLRQDSLWNQGTTTPETGTNSAGDRCEYARMLWTHYREKYDAIFTEAPLPPELDPMHPAAARFPPTCRPNAAMPGNWEKMPAEDKAVINRIMSNQGKAVAAYEAKLISRNAPFDQYVAGDRGAISLQAKRGLKLFVGKAACANCHSGPFFSDLSAHNLGVPQMGPNVPAEDLGFFGGISQLKSNGFNSAGSFSDNKEIGMARLSWLREPVDGDKGKFRTQTLRNLAQSAPYMHTGMFPSVRSTIVYYNAGGSAGGFAGTKDPRMRPLLLSEQEIDDLVVFLEALNGEPIPMALLMNPSQ
jgi:cytochrome c peroxidase